MVDRYKEIRKGKIIFLLSMLLSLSACANWQVQRSGIKDGTYAASAKGYRSNIELEVLFEKKNLKAIKILKHGETDVLCNEAFEKIPKEMIDKQSVNVDFSTGATVTSKAIQSAVSQAIEQAGGNLKEWQKKQYMHKEEKIKQLDTQVVVLGAGPSGMATTLRLRQLGINTVLVDKAKEVGGSFAFATNAYQYVSGTSLDPQSSLLPINTLIDNLQKVGNGDRQMIQSFHHQLAETLRWQSEDLGITFQKKYHYDEKDNTLLSVQYERKKEEFISLFRREIGVSGATLLPQSAFCSYLKEGSKIVGVRVKKADGKLVDIRAKYVVLALGSQLSNNAGLTPVDTIKPYGGPKQDQGDGFLLAKQEGYTISNLLSSDLYQAGANNGKEAVSVKEALMEMKVNTFAISDKHGNLFPVDNFKGDELDKWIKGLEYQRAYLWLSKTGYNKLRASILKTHSLSDKFIKEMNEKDSLVLAQGDSVSEVAKKAGIDLPNGIRLIGQLYCLKLEPYRIQTLAGLKTNINYQLMIKDKAVDNVYAVGSVIGGIFGHHQPLGIANAFSFVSGKNVAEQIKHHLEANE